MRSHVSFLRARCRGVVVHSASLAVLVAAGSPARADAQRRPGVGMGFYTYTGLVTGDFEVGSMTASTALAEVPTVGVSALIAAPIKKATKRAWIVGLRANAFGIGNGGSCFVTPDIVGCQDRRFTERGALMTGGAFDIRSTLLRAMVGPALYTVQGEGARLGTALRLDYGSPRQRGATPTLFFTRTYLGSERGEPLAISTLGMSFRWARKR
ncbi:hypothetical protein [Gemmatimonas phototrophica]|nr:hypothetical protein [Gemmatimonas phototrophica]